MFGYHYVVCEEFSLKNDFYGNQIALNIKPGADSVILSIGLV